MTKAQVRIAVMQMTSTDDVKANLKWILEQLEAMPNDIRLVFFPENSLSINIGEGDKLKALGLEDEVFAQLQKRCLVGGYQIQFCTPTLRQGQVYNSSFWITAEGVEDIYDKKHLFKVKLPQQEIDESKSFQAGSQLCTHEYKEWHIGSSICYDLRYSDMYLDYAKKGVNVLTVPAAFTVRTGRDHWETLLRARAIETQSFVIAAAQTGTHIHSQTQAERKSYGHSLVIDPWGNVLLDAGTQAGAYYCYLDQEALDKTKAVLPMSWRPRA